MAKDRRPRLIIVAGPNGSGKTTLTKKLLQHEWVKGCLHINPDDIAKEKYGDWHNKENFISAANDAERIRLESLDNNKEIIFETVLSKPDKIEFIIKAYLIGYFIRIFYVGTSHPSINAARITYRYMDGGHEVPISKIVQRYNKSIANCVMVSKFVDRAYIYDNFIDGRDPVRMFRTRDGKIDRSLSQIESWAAPIFEAVSP